MSYSRKRGLTPAPEDQDEFEAAIITAINALHNDGSIYFYSKTIAQYNNWIRTRSTLARISYTLKKIGCTQHPRFTKCMSYSMDELQEAA